MHTRSRATDVYWRRTLARWRSAPLPSGGAGPRRWRVGGGRCRADHDPSHGAVAGDTPPPFAPGVPVAVVITGWCSIRLRSWCATSWSVQRPEEVARHGTARCGCSAELSCRLRADGWLWITTSLPRFCSLMAAWIIGYGAWQIIYGIVQFAEVLHRPVPKCGAGGGGSCCCSASSGC